MGLSKAGYVKQISLLLARREHARAYEVASEFARGARGLQPQYFLGVCAYWAGHHAEAAEAARAASGLAKSPDDRISCALLEASALYRLGKFREGFRLLKKSEEIRFSERVEELLIYFSCALGDTDEALKHAKNLSALNRRLASELL